mmetsp:Transcript_64011/g.170121  ORF Transcript_64011/g.170121 Transcript_64011/m.170121 type:complete len:369 (-) Transcript_64011:332-1438(-)
MTHVHREGEGEDGDRVLQAPSLFRQPLQRGDPPAHRAERHDHACAERGVRSRRKLTVQVEAKNPALYEAWIARWTRRRREQLRTGGVLLVGGRRLRQVRPGRLLREGLLRALRRRERRPLGLGHEQHAQDYDGEGDGGHAHDDRHDGQAHLAGVRHPVRPRRVERGDLRLGLAGLAGRLLLGLLAARVPVRAPPAPTHEDRYIHALALGDLFVRAQALLGADDHRRSRLVRGCLRELHGAGNVDVAVDSCMGLWPGRLFHLRRPGGRHHHGHNAGGGPEQYLGCCVGLAVLCALLAGLRDRPREAVHRVRVPEFRWLRELSWHELRIQLLVLALQLGGRHGQRRGRSHGQRPRDIIHRVRVPERWWLR